MNCEEFRTAVLQGDEDSLAHDHERSCPSCQAQAGDLRRARLSLADPALWEEPSPELGGQIEALIGNAAGRRTGSNSKASSVWLRVAVAAAVLAVVGAASTFVLRSPAPDWEVALPSTDLAPNASAVVQGWNENAGTRMVVDIQGLDPAPNGFVYEFWLSEGPLHISAGTFHDSGEVILWSGVSRAEFPRLWITLEPVDEDASPSGQTVLDTGV